MLTIKQRKNHTLIIIESEEGSFTYHYWYSMDEIYPIDTTSVKRNKYDLSYGTVYDRKLKKNVLTLDEAVKLIINDHNSYKEKKNV